MPDKRVLPSVPVRPASAAPCVRTVVSTCAHVVEGAGSNEFGR
jgi:hypothetical protein